MNKKGRNSDWLQVPITLFIILESVHILSLFTECHNHCNFISLPCGQVVDQTERHCSLTTRRIDCLRARIHVSVGCTQHTLSTKLIIELSTSKSLQKTWGNCKQAEWTKIFTLQLRNMVKYFWLHSIEAAAYEYNCGSFIYCKAFSYVNTIINVLF